MRFSPLVRELIGARDRGRCVLCGEPASQVHHRRPRGMGGTTRQSAATASNGILLCGVGGTDGCHGWVETHREDAYALGFLVRQGEEPSCVPIRYLQQHWWLLDDNGGRTRTLPAQ